MYCLFQNKSIALNCINYFNKNLVTSQYKHFLYNYFNSGKTFFSRSMAPKKSAFSTFVSCYKNDENKSGKKYRNFQELVDILKPVWNVSNN